VKGGLFLDIVVRKSAPIFELFAGEDESLLVWWNAFFVLDLGLHVFNGIGGLDLEGDGLAGQSLDEDLHTTSESEDKVQRRLFLDVVVRQGATILKLFAGEDESLLVWWDTFLVLDLSLHIFDSVGGFDLEGDGLAGQGFDEDLHTTSETEDQVEGGLLLDIVVGQGAAIFKLLAGKNESLLVWWNTFLVLDFRLDVFDGIRGFDLEGDGLAGQGFDENLHTTSETQHEMQSRLLLDVVVGEGSAIFKLFSCKNESLLIWGNSFLVLDLSFDVLNGVGGFDFESDGFSGQGFDKDLHTTSKTEDKVKSGLLLDVVVGERAAILELLAGEDESLLVWWDTFFVLDFSLDIFNGV